MAEVGIATHDELRERALQIARGERRRQSDEPKVWFTSPESQTEKASETEWTLLLPFNHRPNTGDLYRRGDVFDGSE